MSTAIINVLAYVAAIVWAVFAAWYQLRARWWQSPEGRNVMGVTVGLMVLFVLVVVGRLAPEWPFRPWLQVAVYSSLIVLGIQRTVQLERAQRRHDRHTGARGRSE